MGDTHIPWSDNHLPKYRKHRASGQAVCKINGRDHYLGLHAAKASKLDDDRLLAEWLASARSTSGGKTEYLGFVRDAGPCRTLQHRN